MCTYVPCFIKRWGSSVQVRRSRSCYCCMPSSGQWLNVGSSPIVRVFFSVMKTEYVVVAEQIYLLGPAYSTPPYTCIWWGTHVIIVACHHPLLCWIDASLFLYLLAYMPHHFLCVFMCNCVYRYKPICMCVPHFICIRIMGRAQAYSRRKGWAYVCTK